MRKNKFSPVNALQPLLSGWSFLRMVRLVLAVFVLLEAWKSSDMLFAFAGGIFLLQAVFNVGCCATGSCGLPASHENAAGQNPEVKYEEIKAEE